MKLNELAWWSIDRLIATGNVYFLTYNTHFPNGIRRYIPSTECAIFLDEVFLTAEETQQCLEDWKERCFRFHVESGLSYDFAHQHIAEETDNLILRTHPLKELVDAHTVGKVDYTYPRLVA